MILDLYNSTLRTSGILTLLALLAITVSPTCAPTCSFAAVVQDDQDDAGDSNDEEDEEPDQEEEEAEPYQLSPNRRRRSRNKRNVEQYSKRADNFVSLFQPVVESASQSVVKVFAGDKQLALGLIVDSDGLILTKASELQGELKCQLPLSLIHI